MNVFLTFDYELFFGSSTGTVQKCLIEPTNRLLEMARKHKASMTFFVDIGYIIALERQFNEFTILKMDYDLVIDQIQEMIVAGCDVQLHIHPHWEKSLFDGEKWQIVTKNAYKLADFNSVERENIVRTYKAKLDAIIGRKTHTFRAGGWCIQPFDQLEKLFQELEIKHDSSVFPRGHFEAGEYSFDFRNAPNKDQYYFQNDACIENEKGFFTEFPIGSYRYSPLFYWRLYILGRLNPAAHKMIGDGIFMSQPGRKKQVLTNFTWNHASTDGFYATKMTKITEIALKNNQNNLVFIGHPKSCTIYSLELLDCYIAKFNLRCKFTHFQLIS
jgi:hypothetical protein